MLKEKIGFIGGGKMGEALCKGIINAKLSEVGNIMVSDVVVERCKMLTKEIGVKTTQNNRDVISFADVIILAVKPQIMSEALTSLKNEITSRHLVVSIAAGIPIRFIESRLQAGVRIIRVMPNTPCLIGVSAT
ncbi:MAG: NAD(P)-binding domain-containing protein, partial [Planctomycetes bacterium]|nr:NAD(P)-binding domain-containing protein [Planctomycetota bacterium]